MGMKRCFLLREAHVWSVFENKVLRRMFGPRRDKVTKDWRKLHSEELHDYTVHLIMLGMLN
jgi:hypothetical protein